MTCTPCSVSEKGPEKEAILQFSFSFSITSFLINTRAMGSFLFSLVSLSLVSLVLSGPCDTIVTFQCPSKGPDNTTTYLPMRCSSNHIDHLEWKLAASPFQSAKYQPYDDITYNPISCAGKDNMLYYLTQDYPHMLLGFDMAHGGKQVMRVQTQYIPQPFWMLQYPPQPNLFLVMANYQYGTLDANTGKWTSLYSLKSEFEAVGFTQRSLSSDFSLLWFEALYSFGQYKPICFNSCMVGVDPLTGEIKHVQQMDTEASWVSSSPLPSQNDNKPDQFSSIFVEQSDTTHRITYTGSNTFSSGKVEKSALFSGPVTYTPAGDFDITNGPFGQFYYVTNAAFPDRTKYYRSIDMESGEETLVVSLSGESVRDYCESVSFTTSAVTYLPNI